MHLRHAVFAVAVISTISELPSGFAAGFNPSAPPGGGEATRTVTYAGTEWTIGGAAVVPAAADTSATVRLDFSVVNQLDTYQISIPMEMLAVELPDGDHVRASDLEGTASEYYVDLEPGATASGSAMFEVPDAATLDVSEMSFLIEEPGLTPAVLPLSGPVPTPAFPMPISATGSTGPIAGTCSDSDRVELTVVGATQSLDLGPQRAEDGTAFLSVDLRLVAVAGSLGYACVDGPFLRLAAGDAVLEPVAGTDISESVDIGTTFDATLAFVVPLDTTSFELRIGADGATTAVIEIAVPDGAESPTAEPSSTISTGKDT